jgi:hypothetical protein
MKQGIAALKNLDLKQRDLLPIFKSKDIADAKRLEIGEASPKPQPRFLSEFIL